MISGDQECKTSKSASMTVSVTNERHGEAVTKALWLRISSLHAHVIPSVFPCGFSSERETASSLTFYSKCSTLLTSAMQLQ